MPLYQSIARAISQLDGTASNEVLASKDMAALTWSYVDNPEQLEAILRIALSHAYRQGAMKATESLAGNIQIQAIEAANRYQMLNDLDESVYSRESSK
jgi:hypothetical protein